MDTKQLKAKILDLAIHGKLLPLETLSELKNSPDYEPASKLLEKLRAEKEEKIAKGELKRDKKDSYIFVGDDNRHYEKFSGKEAVCIEDEIPFEVPEGWAWCRIGQVLELINGRAYKQSELLAKGKYRVLRVGNFFTNSNWYFSDLELEESKYCHKGDLLYAWSASFGPKIWDEDKTIFHYHIWNVKFNKSIFEKMFLYYFLLRDVESIKDSTTGSTMIHVAMENMKPRFICIPPLVEQKHIVSEIERIFSLIDSLETDSSALQLAVRQAKSKILDLAIHGKLVPQDPADEPASVLLEKLRAEKEAKIAKGELKRDKNDSYIYKSTTDNCHYEKFADGSIKNIEDEIPFEVPEGWTWCRLGMIGDWKSGSTPNRKNIDFYKNGTIPWLLTGDLNDGIIKNIPNKITKLAYTETSLKLNPKGSVCIAMYGATIGKLGILDFPATTNQACCVCSDFKGIGNLYLFYYLKQHKNIFIQQGFGGAQPNISKEKIISTLLPLPPLAEQKRIVSKIEELFEALDQIQSNLI